MHIWTSTPLITQQSTRTSSDDQRVAPINTSKMANSDHCISLESPQKHTFQWHVKFLNSSLVTITWLVIFMVCLVIGSCMKWFLTSDKQLGPWVWHYWLFTRWEMLSAQQAACKTEIPRWHYLEFLCWSSRDYLLSLHT